MSLALRPTSTISNAGFTLVGDADVHLCIDEGVDTADDATSYAQSENIDDTFYVFVQDPGFTPVVGAGHKLRIRARAYSIGAVDGEFIAEVYADGTLTELVYSSDRTIISTSFTNYELDLGLSSPLVDYSTLAVFFRDSGTGIAQRMRVTAVELVIPNEFPISGTSAGSSSPSGTAVGRGALAGSADGSSSTSAACVGRGALSGSCAASSQAAGALSAVAALSGTAAGASTTSATGIRAAVGSGTAGGSSTLTATVSGLGSLLGAITTTSTVAGLLIDSSGLGPYELISNAIRLRFQQNVKVPESLPVAWDNAPFAHPGQTTWARVAIRVGEARQIAIGVANDYRKEGTMTVSFFTPLGTGDQAALALADLVKDAFRLVEVDPIVFGVPSVRPGTRDGAFWRVDVTVPFIADFTIDRIAGAAPDNALTFEEAANIARSRFSTIAETSLGLEVIYDGEDDADPEVNATFVRCAVLQGESELVGLGAQRAYRTQGLVMASIYVPVETGEKAGLSKADLIADHFRAVTDRGVTFKTPLVRSSAREGAWWRIGVVCPFQWDEVSA